jgi:hypothetical protein
MNRPMMRWSSAIGVLLCALALATPPAAAQDGPSGLSPNAITCSGEGRSTIRCTSTGWAPGSRVRFTLGDGDKAIGTATAGADGVATVTGVELPGGAKEGTTSITASGTSAASKSAEVETRVDGRSLQAPVIGEHPTSDSPSDDDDDGGPSRFLLGAVVVAGAILIVGGLRISRSAGRA